MLAVGDQSVRPDEARQGFVWSDFLVGLTVLTGGVMAGVMALRFLIG
jgi:hypothetical protein